MAISVDIADRLYDYTDEEKAAQAIAAFQDEEQLDDLAVIAIWDCPTDPRRAELEKLIFDAVDLNGSAKRALETVPSGVSLAVDETIN